MATKPTKSTVLGFLAVAVCITATAIVLLRSNSDTRSVIDEKLLERLVTEVVALRDSLDSLGEGVAEGSLAAPTISQRKSASDSSGDQEDKLSLLLNSVARLEVTLDHLLSDGANLDASERIAPQLRSEYDQMRGQAPTELSKVFESHQSALNELMFLGYKEVLKRLGPPGRVSANNGTVYWWYGSSGDVRFVDGMVSDVSIER